MAEILERVGNGVNEREGAKKNSITQTEIGTPKAKIHKPKKKTLRENETSSTGNIEVH